MVNFKTVLFNYQKNKKAERRWLKEAKSRQISINKKQLELNEADQIGIVVPHADDELIGCYGLLKKYKYNITLFYCGYTGSNVSRDNCLKRMHEFVSFCNFMNVKYFISKGDRVTSFNNFIDSVKPSVLFLPSLVDWHTEHILANQIVKKSCFNGTIYIYEISVPLSSKLDLYNLPMSKKDQKEKWRNFSCFYHSQKNLPKERFIIRERYNTDIDYSCEVYAKLSYENWGAYTATSCSLAEAFCTHLKESINQLDVIDSQANLLWDLIIYLSYNFMITDRCY